MIHFILAVFDFFPKGWKEKTPKLSYTKQEFLYNYSLILLFVIRILPKKPNPSREGGGKWRVLH